MKKKLFYYTALIYCLLGSAALAQNNNPANAAANDEHTILRPIESDETSTSFSGERTEATEVSSPENMDANSIENISEQPVSSTDSPPPADTLTQDTGETIIVETVEPINIEIIPEPIAPFRPTSTDRKILIPEYIIYEANRPDFVITHPNPYSNEQPWFLVGIRTQSMKHFDSWGRLIKKYPVSTAKKGVGEVENSYQTPRGHHKICEKIGDGLAARTIISRRQPTEWFYTEELHKQYPKKDWILTRILWLCGQEEGKNKGYNAQGKVVDSYRRYIYIHGAGDHVPFGVAPSSLGCVRMNSEDVINVFSRAPIGTDVVIDETK